MEGPGKKRIYAQFRFEIKKTVFSLELISSLSINGQTMRDYARIFLQKNLVIESKMQKTGSITRELLSIWFNVFTNRIISKVLWFESQPVLSNSLVYI